MNNLPIALYRYIYKLINPIAIPIKNIKKTIWCKCGDYLKDGNWFFNFINNDFYLLY